MPKNILVEMTCRGCGDTQTIQALPGYIHAHLVDDKYVGTGFCPNCASAHESDAGAQYIKYEETEIN
jgi:hypothetical protein